MLNGLDEAGGAEGVVDDQGQAVGVGNLRDSVDIGDIGVGVAQGLQINGLGVGPDGGGELLQIVGVHKCSGHAELRQGVGQQVVAAAVDSFLSHDVIPRLSKGLDGIGNSRRARGHGQRRYAPFQGGNPLFQHVLGGVGQPAIDVACVRQTEPGGGVGGIPEHITGGLVDGHRPGIGGGVRQLLANMELQGLKFIAHGKYPLSLLLKQVYSYIPTLSIGIDIFLEILFTLWYDREKWEGFL